MSSLHWGRQSQKSTEDFKPFSRIMIVGIFVLISFTLMISDVSDVYIEANSNSVESENRGEAGAEPFGYFKGKWNLWEYIGDFVSSYID